LNFQAALVPKMVQVLVLVLLVLWVAQGLRVF
jgi:hypothetical protein